MTNPFEYMQNMMNQEGFSKNMPNMNMLNMGIPNMDFSKFSSNIKNTAEMFTSTSQQSSENIQSILKKGSENLQETATEMMNSMKDAISSGDVSQITNCQQKFVQKMLDNNFNNTKEIMEAAGKSIMDMMTMMQTNMKDSATQTFNKVNNPN